MLTPKALNWLANFFRPAAKDRNYDFDVWQSSKREGTWFVTSHKSREVLEVCTITSTYRLIRGFDSTPDVLILMRNVCTAQEVVDYLKLPRLRAALELLR